MDIVEMLRLCGDSISNEAAQVIQNQREELSVLREQLEVAASRSQKWKDAALSLAELDEPLPPGTIDEHLAEIWRRRDAKRKLKARLDAGDRRDWDECDRLEGLS